MDIASSAEKSHTQLSSHEKDFDIGNGGEGTPVQNTGARQSERGYQAEHVAHVLIFGRFDLAGGGGGGEVGSKTRSQRLWLFTTDALQL
jgi:hypothetical protein